MITNIPNIVGLSCVECGHHILNIIGISNNRFLIIRCINCGDLTTIELKETLSKKDYIKKDKGCIGVG